MRRLLYISLLLFACNSLFAQEMSVKSFKKLSSMDIDIRIFSASEGLSTQELALIKIVTSEKGFTFNAGKFSRILGSEYKTGEVWVLVSKGAMKLTIQHPELGFLRDYFFPDGGLEASTTYEMVLNSGRANNIISLFELRYTPADVNVVVVFDDVHEKKGENGVVSQRLTTGRHTYKIQAPCYKEESGEIEIVDTTTQEVNIPLVYTCGTIHFSSTPEDGAEVYIDDSLRGTTPFVLEDIEAGEYTIDVKSPLYLDHSETLSVLSDGKQVNVAFTLRPNFAKVTIDTDADCEVFINDISKGEGRQELRLIPGWYTLEARKSLHDNATERIYVTAGNPQHITLEPTLISGTLRISGNVNGARTYLNGEYAGLTPNQIDEIPSGTNHIKVEKYGYITYEGRVTIKDGRMTNHRYKLREENVKKIKPTKEKFSSRSNDKTRYILMPTLGYSKSQMSYGLMLGVVKKAGGYIHGKWNFNSFETVKECNDDGVVSGEPFTPWYTGESQTQRLALTAGYIQRIAKPIYVYIGAGYGYRVLAYESFDGTLIKNIDHSYDGIEAEIGMILRMGKFAISAGVQSNSFKYMEANFGIGFMF